MEFAINVSISASTGYAPFELTGGYMPAMLRELTSDIKPPPGVQVFVEHAIRNLVEAHDAIIAAHVFSTEQVNCHRWGNLKTVAGSLVYVKY